MKAAAVIQARLSSRRLPRKVLLELGGKTVLEQVVARTLRARTVNEVIVATSTHQADLELVRLASGLGIKVFAGSEVDVLDRYYQTARFFDLEHIVRITSDCPVIDPEVIDEVVSLYFEKQADYCSNVVEHTFPDGQDVEVFSFQALRKAWNEARLPSEREHVTPYILKNGGKFCIVSHRYRSDLSSKRWTLDEKRDYLFLKELYRNLYEKSACFGMTDILGFVEAHPDVERINSDLRRNEGYRTSLQKDGGPAR